MIKSKKVKLDSGEQDQELDSLNNAIANSSSSGQVNVCIVVAPTNENMTLILYFCII